MGPKRTLFVLLASVSLVAATASRRPPARPATGRSHRRIRAARRSTPAARCRARPATSTRSIATDYDDRHARAALRAALPVQPAHDKFIPWLAQSGSWTGAKEYTLKLRSGLTWSDGTPLTADDVVYTVNLGKLASVPYSTLWDFLSERHEGRLDHGAVHLLQARYQEWSNWLYSYGIVPAHIWGTQTATRPAHVQRPATQRPDPVGSGPYTLLTYDQQKVVWVKNDSWWGTIAARPEHASPSTSST